MTRRIRSLGYDDTCWCGCGIPIVEGKFLMHHAKTRPAPNKFLVCRNPDHDSRYSECWEWMGSKNKYGYGVHKGRLVHKSYYEDIYGRLSSGIFLDHLCRNRWCVNPDHLEPVDNKENIRRSPHTKLSKELAEEIKALVSNGLSYRKIAAEYGVSKTTVELIVKGKLWND